MAQCKKPQMNLDAGIGAVQMVRLRYFTCERIIMSENHVYLWMVTWQHSTGLEKEDSAQMNWCIGELQSLQNDWNYKCGCETRIEVKLVYCVAVVIGGTRDLLCIQIIVGLPNALLHYVCVELTTFSFWI